MPVEYPLSEKRPELLKSPSGIPFHEITLKAVLSGKVGMDDLRVTAEALEAQAQIAEAAGRSQLAENLRRAAELVCVPGEEIIAVYNAMRPGRATQAHLYDLAQNLDQRYGARRSAAFIREAADAYGTSS